MVTLSSRVQVSRPAKLLGLFSLLFLIWIIYNYRVLEVQEGGNTNLPSGDSDGKVPSRTIEPPVKVILPPPKRVRLDLYYECLCPDSRYFVVHHLAPTWDKLGDVLDIRLWPYGKAETKEKPGGGYSFSCQHGQEECLGNFFHACVARLVPDQGVALDLVKCMIEDNFQPEGTARRCLQGKEEVLTWDRLQACAVGPQGEQLHAEAGKRTQALVPGVTFIPTVELEGSQKGQKQMLKNLVGEVCKVYEAKHKEQAQGCL